MMSYRHLQPGPVTLWRDRAALHGQRLITRTHPGTSWRLRTRRESGFVHEVSFFLVNIPARALPPELQNCSRRWRRWRPGSPTAPSSRPRRSRPGRRCGSSRGCGGGGDGNGLALPRWAAVVPGSRGRRRGGGYRVWVRAPIMCGRSTASTTTRSSPRSWSGPRSRWSGRSSGSAGLRGGCLRSCVTGAARLVPSFTHRTARNEAPRRARRCLMWTAPWTRQSIRAPGCARCAEPRRS